MSLFKKTTTPVLSPVEEAEQNVEDALESFQRAYDAVVDANQTYEQAVKANQDYIHLLEEDNKVYQSKVARNTAIATKLAELVNPVESTNE